MSIRALLVDDEPLARSRIRSFLKGVADIEVIGECDSGSAAVDAIREQVPDLVFLDVQMREFNGFEVLQRVAADSMPVVIFVTAYDEYALPAFEVHAVDYLLKPFDRERFLQAVQRARTQLAGQRDREARERLLRLLDDLQHTHQYRQRIVVKSANKVAFVPVADVDWLEAANNYVRLHTKEGCHLVRETMAHLEATLDPREFVRIHRSTIVKVAQIREIRSWGNGEHTVLLHSGIKLTSSRSYWENLAGLINNEVP